MHALCNDLEKIRQIKAECDHNGIDCCSYGTYFRIGENSVEEIVQYIKAAKLLGTDILRLWCGNKGSADYTEEEKNKLFTTCRALIDISKKEKVKLCMECHPFTFTDTRETALQLMTAMNSPHFRMYWQPNQFTEKTEILAYAENIASYTEVIHAFNWDSKNRYPLGDAISVWKEYLKHFDNIPVLLEFMPDNNLETLPVEVDSLKKIIGV